MCAGTGIDEWFPIQYKGRQSGTVHFKSTWRPLGSGAKPAGTAVGQANMMPGYGMQAGASPSGFGVMGGGVMGANPMGAMGQMQQAA